MTSPLLEILIKETGLPEDLIKKELNRLLKKSGLSPDQVTLEILREVLARYLQDVILEAKSSPFNENDP